MKTISWEFNRGKLSMTASDGRTKELDDASAVHFLSRIRELEKFWNEKIEAMEQYFIGA
jgi:hypothetical protein